MLKELDGVEIPDGSKGDQSVTRLRILWRQPSPGFHHPIGKQEVLELLKSIGPLAMYGLRSIELVRAPALGSTSLLVFGRYEAPGRILLFEQPLSPWRLPGSLASKSVRRLERAGAVVSLMPELGATLVDWPADTLRRFMLDEVLLHELGHHVLLHHKAKRLGRIARTKDQEAFATLFAMRQRLVLRNDNTQV
jgi:hypothetical protein